VMQQRFRRWMAAPARLATILATRTGPD